MNNLRAIKALVIFMGVLIVLGMIALVYGFITKAGNLANNKETSHANIVQMDVADTIKPWRVQIELDVGDSILQSGPLQWFILPVRIKKKNALIEERFIDLRTGNTIGVIMIPAR